MDIRKQFQSQLCHFRKVRGMTQAELSKASGLHPAAIGHFEAGGRMPSLGNAVKLSIALNASVDELIGRGKASVVGGSLSAKILGRLNRMKSRDIQLVLDLTEKFAKDEPKDNSKCSARNAQQFNPLC